jgi:hypothetical protein
MDWRPVVFVVLIVEWAALVTALLMAVDAFCWGPEDGGFFRRFGKSLLLCLWACEW